MKLEPTVVYSNDNHWGDELSRAQTLTFDMIAGHRKRQT